MSSLDTARTHSEALPSPRLTFFSLFSSLSLSLSLLFSFLFFFFWSTHTLTLLLIYDVQISDDPQNAEFWSALGGYKDPSTLAAGEPDTEVAQKKVSKLFEIVDKKIVLVSEGPLDKNMLVSENVFLLHSTEKLFLWVGKQASLEDKKNAMHSSVEYIKSVSYPLYNS